ncbi:MAG: BACON domain-containing protein [Bacteroidales bacterium]|nr:BACON domain-containing protein [Bacteroidales bacterium]
MKKYIIPSALTAALMLLSCAREQEFAPEETPIQTQTITFNADQIDTKTAFGAINSDNTYPIFWQSGDEVAISHNWSDSFTETHYQATISEEGKKASFAGDFSLADGTNTFIVVSPFASAKSQSKTNNRVLVEWPSSQSPILASEGRPSSPDPAAQILCARNDYASKAEVPSSMEMSFNHLSAYLRMRFTNVNLTTPSSGNATVLSVSLSTEDTQLAGRFQYYFVDDSDYKHFGNNSEAFNIVTASVSSFSEGQDIWIGIRPVPLSGKKLIFTISTDKGTLTKEVTLPSNNKYNLSCGSVATFSVNMSGISIVEPVTFTKVTDPSTLNWGDEIIIAAAGSDIALSTTQNTNNRTGTAVTKVDNDSKILDPSSSVEIITLEDGVIPGQFSFHVADGYLYARNDGTIGSDKNILQTIADKTGKENHASWSITNDNGTTRIKANLTEGGSGNTTVRPHLRYNAGDNLFTAYNSKNSQGPIAVYARTPENVGNHFVVTMAADGLTVPYEAGSYPIYIFGNVPWTATVSGNGSLSEASGSGNAVLTLTIPRNETYSEVTHTVTVSTAAGVSPDSYTFTLTQEESKVFLLATSPWQLAEGDKIIIVSYDEGNSKYYAMGTTQTSPSGKAGSRNSVEVEVTNNTIVPGDGVEIINLGSWVNSLYYDLQATSSSAPGYLYADYAYDTANTNSIRTRADNSADNSGHWSISIAGVSATATIRAYESGSESQFNGEIRFNPTDKVFRAYKKTSAMNTLKIYYAPTGTHINTQASFPVQWTFPTPGADWVSGIDYYIHPTGQTGSFVFSNDHYSGRISVVRPTTASTNTYYRTKTINGKTGYFFESNGMGVDAYWLFEVPRISNPAGVYNIAYSTCSTNAGGKLFVMEYSTDGGNSWTAFPGTLFNQVWTKSDNTTVTADYTYVLAEGTNANQEWLDVSKNISLPALNGTLLIRARVSAAVKNDNSALAPNPGGTNTLYNPTISFAED